MSKYCLAIFQSLEDFWTIIFPLTGKLEHQFARLSLPFIQVVSAEPWRPQLFSNSSTGSLARMAESKWLEIQMPSRPCIKNAIRPWNDGFFELLDGRDLSWQASSRFHCCMFYRTHLHPASLEPTRPPTQAALPPGERCKLGLIKDS